jgi:hypothetical protein
MLNQFYVEQEKFHRDSIDDAEPGPAGIDALNGQVGIPEQIDLVRQLEQVRSGRNLRKGSRNWTTRKLMRCLRFSGPEVHSGRQVWRSSGLGCGGAPLAFAGVPIPTKQSSPSFSASLRARRIAVVATLRPLTAIAP